MALALAVSDKWAGTPLADHLPVGSAGGAVVVRPQKEATAAAFAGLDVVFLCTPAEASIALAPVALEAGCARGRPVGRVPAPGE
jgi:N-acetyl-gamma-glutamylphosphate reductase